MIAQIEKQTVKQARLCAPQYVVRTHVVQALLSYLKRYRIGFGKQVYRTFEIRFDVRLIATLVHLTTDPEKMNRFYSILSYDAIKTSQNYRYNSP